MEVQKADISEWLIKQLDSGWMEGPFTRTLPCCGQARCCKVLFSTIAGSVELAHSYVRTRRSSALNWPTLTSEWNTACVEKAHYSVRKLVSAFCGISADSA